MDKIFWNKFTWFSFQCCMFIVIFSFGCLLGCSGEFYNDTFFYVPVWFSKLFFLKNLAQSPHCLSLICVRIVLQCQFFKSVVNFFISLFMLSNGRCLDLHDISSCVAPCKFSFQFKKSIPLVISSCLSLIFL